MPKQLNALPNLRVDIPDFVQQTAGLSVGGQQHLLERFIQSNYPAVIDGFRVEVANQVTAPRTISIINAVAFDRSGAIVNNEDDFAASRSITLPTNGTYYVEVELVLSSSDPDARGLWDPSYNNGSDPSGDARPKGREFSENVNTRLTPDWRIVSPVSTTGFEITTNPDSIKIPVAQIYVSSGQVSGASTTAWRTVLRKPVTTTDSQVHAFDTRGLPDAFTLTLDPAGFNEESLSVTANDRENGILTIAAPPGFNHLAGERGINSTAGASLFLAPSGPVDLDDLPSSQSLDTRQRFFQADPEKGHLLNLDPQSNFAGGSADFERSDSNVISMKAYIDFLAAQIRELKFGQHNQATTGNAPPPFEELQDRHAYYDAAGGVLGARTNTVSIGTGTNSWGDYNVTQFIEENGGVDLADVLLEVFNHINFTLDNGGVAGGGTIFLKRGVYEMSSNAFSIAFAHNLTIVGEGRGETLINLTGALPGLDFDGGGILTLKDLSIVRTSGSATSAVNITLGSLNVENCYIGGISGSISGGSVRNSTIKDSETTLTADMANMTWENVNITCTATANTHRAWSSSAISSCIFRNVTFTSTGTDVDVVCEIGSIENSIFERCLFNNGGTDKEAFTNTSSINHCTFRDCDIFGSGSALNLTAVARLRIEGCFISWNNTDQVGVQLGTDADSVWIQHCYLQQNGGYDGAQLSGAISATTPYRLWIEENDFFDNDSAITFTGTNQVQVRNNSFRSSGVPGRFAITFNTGAINHTCIEGNRFANYQADAVDVRVIYLQNTSGTSEISGLRISGNVFTDIGDVGGTRVNTRCIDLTEVDSSNLGYGVIITDNFFWNVQGETTCYGITGSWLSNPTVRGNSFVFLASTASPLAGWGAVRITDTDGAVIDTNVLDAIGNTSITAVAEAALHVTRLQVNPGSTHNSIVVSNNMMRAVRPNYILGAGIRITDVGSHLTITGNTVNLSSAGIGINIADTDTGANDPQIFNIAITGNTISGNGNPTFGLYATWTRDAAFVGGRCAITGNAIDNVINGITIVGPALRVRGLAITGNIICSGLAANGITMSNVESFTIDGNTINLTATSGAINGMLLASSRHGAITGNTVMMDSNDATAFAMDLHDSTNHALAVSGNSVRFGNGGGAINSHGIWIPTDATNSGVVVFCSGNTVLKHTAGSGAGIAIRRLGDTDGMVVDDKARAQTRAQGLGATPESADFTPSVPGDLAEIGLNFRVN